MQKTYSRCISEEVFRHESSVTCPVCFLAWPPLVNSLPGGVAGSQGNLLGPSEKELQSKEMEGVFPTLAPRQPYPLPPAVYRGSIGMAGDKLPSAPTNVILFKTSYRKAEQLLGLNPACSWCLGEAAWRDSCKLSPVSGKGP